MQLFNTMGLTTKPSQAKPSQAKPSQAKPSQALSFKAWAAPKLALAFACLVFGLTACGGGGGGNTSPATTSDPTTSGSASNTSSSNTTGSSGANPTPTISITCWNGDTVTSKQDCSAFPAGIFGFANVKIVATGSNTFSLSGLGSTSGVISAKLVGGTLTVGDGVSLRVVHTMDKTGALTLSLESGAQLGTPAYSSNYPWTLRFSFEHAADVIVTGTLSTPAAPVVCIAPAMASAANTCVSPPAAAGYTWNNNIKAWVANIGVLVSGANTLPAACLTIGDDCWKANVANGTVKFVNSGSVMTGLNTRPIVFAYYVVTNRFGNPSYNLLAIYGDTEAEVASVSQDLNNGGTNDVISEVKGALNGVLQNILTFGCYIRTFFGAGFGNTKLASCPI